MNKRRVFLSRAPTSSMVAPQCILMPDADEDNIDDSYYA